MAQKTKKRQRYQVLRFTASFGGEKQDGPSEGERRFFREFVGLDASRQNESGYSLASAADGFYPLTQFSVQVDRYADGDVIVPGSEGNGVTSWQSGSCSLWLFQLPQTKGNIFAITRNDGADQNGGIGPVSRYDYTLAQRGSFVGLYNELWEGNPAATSKSQQYGSNVTYYPTSQFLGEGTPIVRRNNEWGMTASSMWGLSIYTDGRNRPLVVVNRGSGTQANATTSYLAGITAPLGPGTNGGPPTVTFAANATGFSTGTWRFGVTRIDTLSRPGFPRMSLPSPASAEHTFTGTAQKVTFTDLDADSTSFKGDTATGCDTWDSFGLCAYSVEDATWYLCKTVTVGGSYVIDTTQPNKTDNADATFVAGDDGVTGLLWPLPACRSIISMVDAKNKRLVLCNQVGFDAFVDMPGWVGYVNAGTACGVPGFSGGCPKQLWFDQYFTGDQVTWASDASHSTVTFAALPTGESFAAITCYNSAFGGSVNIRDGTWLLTGHDEIRVNGRTPTGQEVFRGFIGTGGTSLSLQVWTTKSRSGTPAYFSNMTVPPSAIRWRIRRQVIAKVTNGSRRVQLTHDTAGAIPALVGKQFMVWQNLRIGSDTDGGSIGTIFKAVTLTKNSLDGVTVGSELILVTAYEGTTLTGTFTTSPDKSSVWFGLGDSGNFDCTSPKHQFQCTNNSGLQMLGIAKSRLMAVSASNDIFRFDVNAISDPEVLSIDPADGDPTAGFIGFDISQSVTRDLIKCNHSCCSAFGACNDNEGNLYWIGTEGPYLCDGGSATLIIEDNERDRWRAYCPIRLQSARSVFDKNHAYCPVVRFFGMSLTLDGYTTQQLVWVPSRKAWFDFGGLATMDSACVAESYNGQDVVLFGGNRRIYQYADPGAATTDQSCYAAPGRFGYTSSGVVLPNAGPVEQVVGHTSEINFPGSTPPTTTWPAGSFQSGSQGLSTEGLGAFSPGARHQILKWDDDLGPTLVFSEPFGKFTADGMFEQRQVVSASTNSANALVASSAWTWTDNHTYFAMLNPRPWSIIMPIERADGYEGTVRLSAFNFEAEDVSNIDFPILFWVFDSGQGATIGNLVMGPIYFKKSSFAQQWANFRPNLPGTHKYFLRLSGYAPADSPFIIKSVTAELVYGG